MANDTAKTQTTNIVPVQGIFGPLPPYPCITLVGPAGEYFYAPTNPNLDGVSITNSTINSTTIGLTTPAAAAFTNIATTTGTISSVPSGPTSLVNQQYVDAVAQGLSFKQPANYTTLGNITLSGLGTQANGDWASSLTAGMRILVKNQSAPSENGIYVAASSGWSRSSDANTWDELLAAYLFILEGATWGGSAWVSTIAPGGTLGVTAVTFTQFSNTALYTAGTGLTLNNYQFSITNTTVTAGAYGSASNTLTATVNAQGQLTSLAATPIAIANTQVSGLGTMSTQNANTVAITGGNIDGTTIGGSTAAAITGTTVTANTQFSGPGTGITGTASALSIGGNAATATSATTATNLAGGATGSLPYQSGAGATTFLAAGTNGYVLTLAGGVPTWAAEQFQGDVVGPASATDNALARYDGSSGKLIQNSGITLSDAGALQNVNEINFDTTPTSVVGGQGSLFWNSSEGTLDLVMRGGNTTQHIGEEVFYTARNATGSTINKATPVYASGVTAGSKRIEISPMIANGTIDELRFVGLTSENISNGVNGFVTEFGYIRNIDTSGAPYGQTWATGDIIYVSPTTAGYLTNVLPVAPNLKIVVAIVIEADNNFGVLLVRPTAYPQIDNLSNVNIATVTGGDLLVYDGTDSRWENAAQSTITAGKATNLAGGSAGQVPYQSATDTTLFTSTGTTGQVLTSNGSSAPSWTTPTAYATVTDDTTTNAARYVMFANQTAGNLTTTFVASTKFQFNPSSGDLSATSFSGAGTGLTGTASSLSIGGNAATATSSTTATNLAGGANGSIPYQTGSGTTTFLAAGTNGNVITLAGGVPTWAAPDPAGITITDDTTTNATRYITFTSSTTGSITGESVSSTKLQFNPSTGILTTTEFSGAGTGLTGTASGLSIGGNAATATSSTTSTNLAGGASGNVPYQTASGTTTFLATGSNGQVLTLASGVPSWATPTTGTVTSVGGTGTVSGISLSGTVTSSGNLSLGGTLDLSSPPAIGGTAPSTGTFTDVTLNAQGDVRFADSDSSNWVAFQGAATISSNVTWTLPASDGTNGQVLSTNGSGTLSWASSGGGGGGFVAGTRMLFVQTSAPTGWTKDTTNYDNHAIRVVTGTASTGGSVNFTTAFVSQSVSGTVGATTLTTNEMPSHTHPVGGTSPGAFTSNPNASGWSSASRNGNTVSAATGGGGSHDHSFTGTAINLAVKYLDVITATKD